MVEDKFIIRNETGLHARPAALFVQKANLFKSDIRLVHGKKDINAKSMIGVLSLGAVQGSEVLIRAEGEDALHAVDVLGELLTSLTE